MYVLEERFILNGGSGLSCPQDCRVGGKGRPHNWLSGTKTIGRNWRNKQQNRMNILNTKHESFTWCTLGICHNDVPVESAKEKHERGRNLEMNSFYLI